MLKYRRPAWSHTEEAFIERFIDPVPGVYCDGFGNRILLNENSRVMIACHTDTVHTRGGKQRVRVWPDGVVSLHGAECMSNCLGADDTAGVYAALRMIEAGVEATFIFHRDEECGGRGSSWLAREYAEWLANEFDVCLSLDRRGTRDIITHQGWQATASHKFAWSLANALDMGHRPAEGVFTDSANYADLIPECSNLSVGYDSEHSRKEMLDTVWLERLIARLCKVDWTSLAVERDPSAWGCDTVDDWYDEYEWWESADPCDRWDVCAADDNMEAEQWAAARAESVWHNAFCNGVGKW